MADEKKDVQNQQSGSGKPTQDFDRASSDKKDEHGQTGQQTPKKDVQNEQKDQKDQKTGSR